MGFAGAIGGQFDAAGESLLQPRDHGSETRGWSTPGLGIAAKTFVSLLAVGLSRCCRPFLLLPDLLIPHVDRELAPPDRRGYLGIRGDFASPLDLPR